MACRGTKVSDLTRRVSSLLGDQGSNCAYQRWTKATLIDILNDARCWLVGLRPDAFSEMVDLPLGPGAEQRLPDEYQELVKVITANPGTANESGVGSSDPYYATALRGKSCLANACAPSAYTLQSASVYEKQLEWFTVYPPVPVGVATTVRALVVRKPCPYCPADESKDLDFDCQFVPAVIEYMLARAYGMEIDSPSSEVASARHLGAAFQMIDRKYLYDQRFGSGYWRGAVGDKDPQFRSR